MSYLKTSTNSHLPNSGSILVYVEHGLFFFLIKIISQVDLKQHFSWQLSKTLQIKQTSIGFVFKVLFI